MVTTNAAITWLGQGTLVFDSSGGTRIIIDPWLEGNPKCPIAFREIGHLDGIVVTHGHFDHMADAPSLARATGAPVIANPEIAGYLASQGIENRMEMNKGGTVTVGDVSITMVHADHSSGISTAMNDQPNVEGGEAVGLILRDPSGDVVYVAGDTNVFGDMRLIRELYAPELGFLPIDGNYNMGPREAAYAVELLGLQRVVPIHFGTFPILKGTPEDFRQALQGRTVNTDLVVIDPGQSVPLRAKASV